MSDGTYNGFVNKATWLVCLWVDNEYEIYKQRVEWQRGHGGTVTGGQAMEFVNRMLIYDSLRGLVSDMEWGDGEDIAGTRWQDVNWKDVAEHWSEEDV